jgi:hypothetical protein
MLGCPALEQKKSGGNPVCGSIPFGSLVCAAFALASVAQAQDYPAKPIRVIASSAAGGISDIFMRTVSEELSRRWGQPIVIENRAGGGMNIGGRACAEAPPDGTTICIMSNEVVTYNQYLYKNPGFDAEKSIAPVTNLFFLTQALVVNSALKVNSLAELAALSKAKPGTLSYSAPAAPLALFMDNFNKENGADLVRVPFKGGGDAVNGVAHGRDADYFSGRWKSDRLSAERNDDWPRARRRATFTAIPRHPDAAGNRLSRPVDAVLFRSLCADGHAAGFHRKDRQRYPVDRERGSLPRQKPDRTRARARVQYARGVRAVPQAGSDRGPARRQRRRPAATMRDNGSETA